MTHSSFMQGIWFIPSLVFGVVQGLGSGSWQMLLFTVLSLSIWPVNRWLKEHRNFALEGLVHFDGKDVWIGDHRLPKREIFWRKDWHEYILAGFNLDSAIDAWPTRLLEAKQAGFRGATPSSIWLGLDVDSIVDFDLAAAGPHLLIVGATGTGKSELLRLLVTGWVHQQAAVQLSLIDFKGGATLARFAEHPRVVALATDLATTDALTIALSLERQLMSRQELLAQAQVSNIESAWRHGIALDRQIIVIDELGELLRQHPRLTGALEQIAGRGRSLGMHLVVTNQSMAGITRSLLVNLRARVAIGDMDPIDLSQLGFRSRPQTCENPNGWRSARLKTGDGFEMCFSFPIGF